MNLRNMALRGRSFTSVQTRISPMFRKRNSYVWVVGPLELRVTLIQIEEGAHALCTGINALQPAVERLVEVVEVLLSEALVFRHVRNAIFSHADKPAVVLANGQWEVATTSIEGCTEVVCTNIDVGPGLHTSVRDITAGALFGSNLHEPLLGIVADGAGVAGGLLHSDRSDENGRDAVLLG